MATLADTDYGSSEVSDVSGDDLFRRLKCWYFEDIPKCREWRKNYDRAWGFYTGSKQWTDEDVRKLKSQRRPAITFNYIASMVNAVVGSEINNRREVRYFPREPGDAVANEMLTDVAEWFRDQCGAEDEESDAFKCAVIGGMGFVDTTLDFETDPDGAPKMEKMDPREMVWDWNSVKANLIDAQRMFRVRTMSVRDAIELTGVKDIEILDAAWASALDSTKQHDQDAADNYDGTQSDDAENRYKRKVTIVEARWLDPEVYYRGPDVENPNNPQPREYTKEQVDLAEKFFMENYGQPFQSVKQTRKVVRRAFLGSDVLGKPDKPLVPPGMLGWEAITGYRDEVECLWYGVVKNAEDPQAWTNKFFSQVQYILNTQAKGGVLAERGAFENDRDAEHSWAKSEAITWVKAGKLSGDRPAIMPKTPAQFPAGFFTLFQETKEAINDVTGLSLEFIGTREVDQAGVLEHQRRQSSLNLLAELFNSLRRYRKRQGRELLFLIQNHLADGRLVRISGEDKKQYVQLTKAAITSAEYDIIVDDAPNSPNEKERNWALLMQILPMVKDMMTPEILLSLLKYSPMPASIAEELRTILKKQQQQPPPPDPKVIEAQTKAQAAQQSHQIDMAGKQMDLQAEQAKVGMELQAQQADMEMDRESKAIDLFIKQREGEMKLALGQAKLEQDAQRLAIQEQANNIARDRANTQRVSAAKQ